MTDPSPDLPGDFLFLDESGDLGQSPKSSSHLTIAILHLRSETCMKRISKRVRRKKLKGASARTELKWSNSSEEVRVAMLQEIVKAGDLIAGVSACVMPKAWANKEHASRPSTIRYDYAARFAMERGRLFDKSVSKRVTLTIDEQNIAATEAMREHLSILKDTGELCCDVTLRGGRSHEIEELQAADFIVGAVAAGWGRGAWDYVNILRRGGVRFSVRVPGGKGKDGQKKADS